MDNSFHFFSLYERGMKGDLMAFQNGKLLQMFKNTKQKKRSSAFDAFGIVSDFGFRASNLGPTPCHGNSVFGIPTN